MKWRQRRKSANVEDRRGAAAAGGTGLVLMLVRFVIGRFGVRGVLLLVLAGLRTGDVSACDTFNATQF